MVYECFAPEPGDDDAAARGEIAKRFAEGRQLLVNETVDDVPDWALNHAKLARFVVRKR